MASILVYVVDSTQAYRIIGRRLLFWLNIAIENLHDKHKSTTDAIFRYEHSNVTTKALANLFTDGQSYSNSQRVQFQMSWISIELIEYMLSLFLCHSNTLVLNLHFKFEVIVRKWLSWWDYWGLNFDWATTLKFCCIGK